MSPLTFPCQKCGAKCTDPRLRVPGHKDVHKLGRVLMEQYVCRSCFDACVADLDEHFAESETSNPSICNHCGDESFGGQGPYFAHRQPLITGDWKTIPVCGDCFDEYHTVCKKNKNGG